MAAILLLGDSIYSDSLVLGLLLTLFHQIHFVDVVNQRLKPIMLLRQQHYLLFVISIICRTSSTLCMLWIVIVHVFFLTHEFSNIGDKT